MTIGAKNIDYRLAALFAALPLACGGGSTAGERTQSAETTRAVTGSFCGDVPPLGGHTCAEHAGWEQCGEPWMDGFCSTSCGRCAGVPSAAADACPGSYPASPEVADQAYPRIDYPWMSLEDWCRRHARVLAMGARRDAEVVFVGDSITEGWLDAGRDVWDSRFGAFHPLNAGVGGDRTSHILWRIEHGALDVLPRARGVVLLAGVNNLRSEFSPSDTARGIGALLQSIAARIPGAHVLVLGVLPAERSATDPFRQKVLETNVLIAQVAAQAGADYRDIGARFLQPDGTIAPEVMADALHPTRRGYEIFADGLADALPGLVRP